MSKTIAGTIGRKWRGRALTDKCRQYATARRLFKNKGRLLVEYIFKDGSSLVKPF